MYIYIFRNFQVNNECTISIYNIKNTSIIKIDELFKYNLLSFLVYINIEVLILIIV